MMRGGLFLLIGMLSGGICFSQAPEVSDKEYRDAVASVDKDLDTELAKLAQLRKKIAAEKPELSKKAHQSALTLRQKKRQFEIAKATQASVDHRLEDRRRNLKLWRDERLYLDGLLADFRKNYRGTIPLPEANSMEAIFSEAGRDGDSGTASSLELVEQMTQQLEEQGRARVIPGEAIGKDGVMIQGKFAVAGPLSWFASDDGALSGLVRESSSLHSEVVRGTGDKASILALLEGRSAELSFDPTLGNAIAMDEVEGDWRGLVKKGGIWIYPILFLAVVALVSAVGKWVQLIGVRSLSASQVQAAIDSVNEGKFDAAKSALGKMRHPARTMLERGIEVAKQPIETIEEVLYEKYLEAQPRLQRGLPLIAIASATAPLLGLLGTVTGMIKTFNQITIFGTGDAKSLSSGISEALITTAFGLIVAIPALILHALLSRKVQGIRSAMEMVSLAFVNGIRTSHDRIS